MAVRPGTNLAQGIAFTVVVPRPTADENDFIPPIQFVKPLERNAGGTEKIRQSESRVAEIPWDKAAQQKGIPEQAIQPKDKGSFELRPITKINLGPAQELVCSPVVQCTGRIGTCLQSR